MSNIRFHDIKRYDDNEVTVSIILTMTINDSDRAKLRQELQVIVERYGI